MANNLTQAERMVKVETNLSNLNEKVDTGFSQINTSIKDLGVEIRTLVPTLVTQKQLTEKVTDLEKKLVELNLELVTSKKRSSFQTWLTSSLSAILAVVLTILIQNYFKG